MVKSILFPSEFIDNRTFRGMAALQAGPFNMALLFFHFVTSLQIFEVRNDSSQSTFERVRFKKQSQFQTRQVFIDWIKRIYYYGI